MLSGGGGGIYDSGNPLFWGDGGGNGDGDGSSEERTQHLQLTPVVSCPCGYPAAAAAATTAPAAAAAAAGLASTVSPQHKDAMPGVSTTIPHSSRGSATAAFVARPPAKRLARPGLGLGLKLLLDHEEEGGSGEEEKKEHSRGREEQAAEVSEPPQLAQDESEDQGLLL